MLARPALTARFTAAALWLTACGHHKPQYSGSPNTDSPARTRAAHRPLEVLLGPQTQEIGMYFICQPRRIRLRHRVLYGPRQIHDIRQ